MSSLTSQDFNTFKSAPPNTQGWNETDSNADTCCLGINFTVIQYTERTADVYPYNSSYKPLHNVPIVSGATAWDNPDDGVTWILVVNEGLFYGSQLDHSLLNPNQLRHHGLMYQDNPFNKEEALGIHCYDEVTIPLEMKGTKIRFNTRVPTTSELETIPQSNWIYLTSSEPWNPSTVQLSSVLSTINEAQINNDGTSVPDSALELAEYADDGDYNLLDSQEIKCVGKMKRLFISAVHATINCFKRKICENNQDVPARRTLISSDRHSKLTAETLAEHWCIGPKRAQATLKATLHKGTRSAILPIARRYRADRMYQVKRLNWKMATDTLYSDEK